MADVGNQEFPTIIGPDASFKGELQFEKGLRLMGKFEGRITSGGRLHIEFDVPQRALSPGQSAVLYLDDIVLGGGIIARAG